MLSLAASACLLAAALQPPAFTRTLPASSSIRAVSRPRPMTKMVECTPDPITQAPGDPSLILHTNVLLGDKKTEFLLAASRAVSSCLNKPESYVAVCVHDGAALVFGGSAEPAAVACLYSIGSINQPNNAALTAAISELLLDFQVPNNRIYINFFDVPRENCGWSGRTFAG
mmetsp:Transcript_21624/g.47271  ORF Transcript_21624/g.47271 Transcript_21624/m.47271 type:complete len:171 (-) Transcript_21624:360-872(-)